MSKDGEQARQRVIEKIQSLENENVLRSICFVLGDYGIDEKGEERAVYITAILAGIASTNDIELLSTIYSFTAALCGDKGSGGKA